MKDADEKLRKLEEKRAKVEAEIKRMRAAASATERKRDTRRKLLVGAVVLAAAERGEMPRAPLMALLDRNLVRPHDRALFDLQPTPADNPSARRSAPPSSGSAPKAPSAPPGTSPTEQPTARPPALPQPSAPLLVPRGTFVPRKDTEDL